ncbi:MAG: ATP-binding cassette domain-containing protein, partial [Candidatus Heimdallarchaeota archaeon]|nr:ATP-binding cassette domain-containing protein [Candidatus Heimdallarchaeota archaeon]
MLKSKNAKFEADLKDPFVSIINFRAQVTGLRLWIHSFEDLPSFTSLSDGIAYEYVENETYEPTKSALIEGLKLFKNYSRGNSTIYALRGVNVLINEGDFVIIRGPSGSGKTTLLNTLSGLDTVGRGAVFFRGE